MTAWTRGEGLGGGPQLVPGGGHREAGLGEGVLVVIQTERVGARAHGVELAVDEAYFTGKVITTEAGKVEITAGLAKQIYKYLIKNDYIDNADRIAEAYHEAKAGGTLAALPPELAPHAEQIFGLIDSVFSESQLPDVGDDRKPKTNPLNANFEKKEFKALWSRINSLRVLNAVGIRRLIQPFLTLSANLEIPAMFARVKPKQRRARAQELAELVGLEDRMRHLPRELSGGQIPLPLCVKANAWAVDAACSGNPDRKSVV